VAEGKRYCQHHPEVGGDGGGARRLGSLLEPFEAEAGEADAPVDNVALSQLSAQRR
jgi:hypothetical protein